MNTQGISAEFPLQLTDTFQVRQRFDITYGTTDFSDDKVKFILVSKQFDVTLDFISNVRDNLNGLTQIVSMTFFVNYTLVDTACGNVVGLGSLDT